MSQPRALSCLRIEGTDYLLSVRGGCGGSWRRAMARSRTHEAVGAVKGEEDPLDPSPARGMRGTVAALRHLEQAVLGADWTEGIVLRYGAFYGPGTSLARSAP
jgi:hypothetical protein